MKQVVEYSLLLITFAPQTDKIETIMITADQLKDVLEREHALRGYL